MYSSLKRRESTFSLMHRVFSTYLMSNPYRGRRCTYTSLDGAAGILSSSTWVRVGGGTFSGSTLTFFPHIRMRDTWFSKPDPSTNTVRRRAASEGSLIMTFWLDLFVAARIVCWPTSLYPLGLMWVVTPDDVVLGWPMGIDHNQRQTSYHQMGFH